MSVDHLLSISVSRTVAASPSTVYGIVSDVSQLSRLSPETCSAHWLDGARAAAVGARFHGQNRVGRLRWSTRPVVTEAAPGERFAFRVPSGALSSWTYVLDAVDGGTLVTESVRTERAMPTIVRLLMRSAGVRDRRAQLRAGMVTTLDRLAEAVASAQNAPTALANPTH